jgi:hypothetical protein
MFWYSVQKLLRDDYDKCRRLASTLQKYNTEMLDRNAIVVQNRGFLVWVYVYLQMINNLNSVNMLVILFAVFMFF